MTPDTAERNKIKSKTFTYKTNATWTGGRSGTMSAEGKPSLKISSPPEFKGEPGVWSSEDMFVASVEACHMQIFIAHAAREDLEIISYKSHTNGVLEFIDGEYRFTRIVIFPTITVSSRVVESDVHTILREAQRHCLVANSIASIVEVNPTIIVQ
jgi:organic hydroperoxide reductase OsmC/OhrA